MDDHAVSDDQIELAILKSCVDQHKRIEVNSGKHADKCAREVDIRVPIQLVAGAQGSELDYLAGLWLDRLAPPTPGVDKGVLRRCSRDESNRGAHRYHARAFTDRGHSPPAPAWERIRELEDKIQKRIPKFAKEKEQKFGILLSEPQEEKDFEGWRSGPEVGFAIGVLFLDIDLFKKLNTDFTETKIDTTVLPDFQKLIRRLTNHRGGAYRHGGEEFVIILPNHDLEETKAFAEKVRSAVQCHPFHVDLQTVALTVSIGVAVWPMHGNQYAEVLSVANKAEHSAKKSGRNRVELATLVYPVNASL